MTERMNVDMIVKATSQGFDKVRQDIGAIGPAGEQAGKGLEKAGSASMSLEGVFKRLVAAGLIAKGGQMLLEFGKKSITAASNLQEMESKFNIVFGDLAPQATERLAEFADSVGRSTSTLMGMASQMQDTFVPMGFARDQAADLSQQMVELAVDLSSFNNMSMDEALRALQGTLVGAHRNALQFGVVINENVLSQELARMGAADLTGELLEQAKVQARVNLLIAGTTDAQGDAARTAGSYANQQRALDAAMGDLQETIGTQLLPALTALTTELVTIVKWTNENYAAMNQWGSGIARVQRGIATLGITELLPVMKDARTETRSAAETAEDLAAQIYIAGGTYADFRAEVGRVQSGTVDVTEAIWDAAAAHNVLERATRTGTDWDRNFRESVSSTSSTLQDYAVDLDTASGRLEYAAAVYRDAQVNGGAYEVTADQVAAAEQRRADAHDEAAEAARLAADATHSLSVEAGKLFTGFLDTTKSIGFYNETAAQMVDRQVYVSNATGEQREVLAGLRKEYERQEKVIRDYTVGVQSVGIEEDKRNEKIAEARERMGQLEAAMAPLIDLGGEYANITGSMTLNQDAINEAIWRTAQNSELGAEKLALMAAVFGDYSDEAVEAALKSALIEQKIQELVEEFGNGERRIESIRGELNRFIEDLDRIPGETNTMINVDYNIPPWPGIPGMPTQALPGQDAPAQMHKTGGFTGHGHDDEIAGFVHRNELVIPANVLRAGTAADYVAQHTGSGGGDTYNIYAQGAGPGVSQEIMAALQQYTYQQGREADIRIRAG